MTALYSDRCCIQTFESEHIESALTLFTDSEVRKYLGGTLSPKRAAEKLQKWAAGSPESKYFAVTLKDGTFIGIIDISPYCGTETKEISYLFLSKCWGLGLAQESIREVLSFCKTELGVDFLVAETQKKNTRSRALLERLSFSLREEVERFGEMQCVYQLNLKK